MMTTVGRHSTHRNNVIMAVMMTVDDDGRCDHRCHQHRHEMSDAVGVGLLPIWQLFLPRQRRSTTAIELFEPAHVPTTPREQSAARCPVPKLAKRILLMVPEPAPARTNHSEII